MKAKNLLWDNPSDPAFVPPFEISNKNVFMDLQLQEWHIIAIVNQRHTYQMPWLFQSLFLLMVLSLMFMVDILKNLL